MHVDGPAKHARHVWDRAWTTYDLPPADCHEPLVAAIERALGTVDGARILEVGAGSARDSVKLAEMGAHAVSVDYSAPALDLARRGMEQRGVSLLLVQADGFRLPFRSELFDAVFSQGVMEHFSDPRPLLAEQVRVLRPGGVLLVDVPQTFNVYTIRKKIMMRAGKWFAGWETSYSLPALEQLVARQGLSLIDAYGSGYFPRQVLAIRHVHTFDQRHKMPVKLPGAVRRSIEGSWQWLERRRWYYRWMWNIGVIARKESTKKSALL